MEAIPDDPGRRGAVAIIVHDEHMLVIRRARGVVAPGAYCFPGGGIEQGESEEAAVVREIREEIGVAIRPLRRLWECVTPWKVELAWWLAAMTQDSVPLANPREVASIHWFTPNKKWPAWARAFGKQPPFSGLGNARRAKSAWKT